MIIEKSKNGFIIENKDKKTVSFNTDLDLDLNIFSFEKKMKNKILFDQEGEYEAYGIEVQGFSLGDNLNTGFVVKTDGKKVFLLDQDIKGFNEKVFGTIDEIDILIVNIPVDGALVDIDLVKSIFEKLSPKTVVFSGDEKKIKAKFEKLENGEEKIKIGANPDNPVFYFV